MKEKLIQQLKDVDNSYNVDLLKLPKAVRKMPWMEFYSKSRPPEDAPFEGQM